MLWTNKKTKCLEDSHLKQVQEAYDSNRGNLIRAEVRKLAAEFSQKPDELTYFFRRGHPLLRGLATSAYYQLTGDFDALFKAKFGGLGAIVNETPVFWQVNKSRFHYATVEGGFLLALVKQDAFKNADLYRDALTAALICDSSLEGVHAHDESLTSAELYDSSLRRAMLVGSSGTGACLADETLEEATIGPDALADAIVRSPWVLSGATKIDSDGNIRGGSL